MSTHNSRGEKADFSIPEVFWSDERTMPIWREKRDEALAALAVNDMVVLSGRFGTGKSQQFGARMFRSLEPAVYFDEPHIIDYASLSTPNIIIDEVAGFVENRGDRAARLVKGLEDKKSVLIFPGASRDIRRNMVNTVLEKATAETPSIRIHDAGDVSHAHIETEMAARALHALGGTNDAIELVGNTSALRNPRVFDRMFFSGLGYADRFTSSDIHTTVNALTGTNEAIRALEPNGLHHTALNNVLSGLGQHAERRAGNHPLFYAGSLSTAEAIQLYGLAGAELPDATAFDTAQLKLGFHPYRKD